MTASITYSPTVQILALTRFAGVGPRLFDLLFCHFASPTDLFAASPEKLLGIQGVSPAVVDKIAKAIVSLEEAARYHDSLRQREIGMTTRFDDAYGHLLSELNDPPALLYFRGSMPDPNQKVVSLLGASEPTAEGVAWTTSLARTFAKAGVQVVSSLRGGNDAAAHLGNRVAGGKSFAIIEGGFDQLDKAEQVPLAIDIARAGGVISEYSPDAASRPEDKPEVNRLIAALGQAVVITEIYRDSTMLWDILEFCNQIGKLAMVTVDPTNGPLSDKESLIHAAHNGAVILHGPDPAGEIIRSLV